MRHLSVAWLWLIISCQQPNPTLQSPPPAHSLPASVDAPQIKAVPAKQAATALLAQAQTLYQTRCSLCHGNHGHGDGPAATGLRPKPTNLASKKWADATSDATIAQVIVEGGASIGKSMLMPANPDLRQQPELTQAVVLWIRGFTE